MLPSSQLHQFKLQAIKDAREYLEDARKASKPTDKQRKRHYARIRIADARSYEFQLRYHAEA